MTKEKEKELVKEFAYVVKDDKVCVDIFSITENRWKYVTPKYFEKHCILLTTGNARKK